MLNRIVPTWSNSLIDPGANVLASIEKTSWSGRSKLTTVLQSVPFDASQLPSTFLTIRPVSGAGSPAKLSRGPGTPYSPKPSVTIVSVMAVVSLPEWKEAR